LIAVTPQMRVLLAVEPADFRKGIDGLSRVCKQELESDPFSGRLFVFRNRRRTAVKILGYDGRGFWLCQMRLSSGRFCYWPASGTKKVHRLEPHEFSVLLAGGDPCAAPGSPLWRSVDGGVEEKPAGGLAFQGGIW
jgi:transposase